MMRTVPIFLRLSLNLGCYLILITALLCLRLFSCPSDLVEFQHPYLLVDCVLTCYPFIFNCLGGRYLKSSIKASDQELQSVPGNTQLTSVHDFCFVGFLSLLQFGHYMLEELVILVDLYSQGGNVGHLHKLLGIESSSQVCKFFG